nr:basic proline-rich protein-like [Aegilops tauschii subsp. strangulata]
MSRHVASSATSRGAPPLGPPGPEAGPPGPHLGGAPGAPPVRPPPPPQVLVAHAPSLAGMHCRRASPPPCRSTAVRRPERARARSASLSLRSRRRRAAPPPRPDPAVPVRRRPPSSAPAAVPDISGEHLQPRLGFRATLDLSSFLCM